jgi:hypothetical protein
MSYESGASGADDDPRHGLRTKQSIAEFCVHYLGSVLYHELLLYELGSGMEGLPGVAPLTRTRSPPYGEFLTGTTVDRHEDSRA